ncbi:MAG: hypothetical protein IT457_21190 [Planctomycetes bacterium]|nr:hypothetical protein [Planctomycetota bacterium]
MFDPATGTTTALGVAGLSLITALDSDASGRVWGIDFGTGNLATIDKTTGAATVVATISPTNMQGLSVHPNGTWYAINTTTDSLYVIDPATSSSLLIGTNTGTQFVKGFQIADTAIAVGGTPCADGAAGIRRMTWSGSSAIGGTLQLGFETGPSATVGSLIFGFSAESFGPFPLPLDLSPFGAPGCNLYVSADITSGTVLSGVPTALAMPNTPSLVGGVFFVQAAVVDISATPNALGLAFTDFVRVVVTN